MPAFSREFWAYLIVLWCHKIRGIEGSRMYSAQILMELPLLMDAREGFERIERKGRLSSLVDHRRSASPSPVPPTSLVRIESSRTLTPCPRARPSQKWARPTFQSQRELLPPSQQCLQARLSQRKWYRPSKQRRPWLISYPWVVERRRRMQWEAS